MLEIFQKIGASIFIMVAMCFGILSAIKTFEYAVKKKAEDKIKGAKISAIYLILSLVGFFLAVEIYMPNIICIPLFFVFLLLFWVNYIIYKKTTTFLEK